MRYRAYAVGMVLLLLGSLQLYAEEEAVDPVPPPGKALLYLLHDKSKGSYWIFKERKLLTVLPKNSFALLEMEPGPHLLWGRCKSRMMPQLYGMTMLNLEEGEIAYVVVYGEWSVDRFREIEKDSAKFYHPTLTHPIGRPTAEQETKAASMIALRYGPSRIRSSDRADVVEEGSVLVPRGTLVGVELVENLTSYHVRPYSGVRFRVVEDVVIEDQVVIGEGQEVIGVVGQVDRASGTGQPGRIDVETVGFEYPDGTFVRLLGYMLADGERDPEGVMAGAAAASQSPSLMVLNLPGLFKKGTDPWLPRGTVMGALTFEDVYVKPPKVVLAEEEHTESDLKVEGTVAGSLKVPPNGRVKGEITVQIDTEFPLQEVRLIRVGERRLQRPERPVGIRKRRNEQEVVFSAWQIIHWIFISGERFDSMLELEGRLKDSRTFSARIPVQVTVGR